VILFKDASITSLYSGCHCWQGWQLHQFQITVINTGPYWYRINLKRFSISVWQLSIFVARDFSHFVLLQADKLKAALMRYKQNQQLKIDTSQRTPGTSKDVMKKASLSGSKSVPRTSAKSTPQLTIANVDQVLQKIHCV